MTIYFVRTDSPGDRPRFEYFDHEDDARRAYEWQVAFKTKYPRQGFTVGLYRAELLESAEIPPAVWEVDP